MSDTTTPYAAVTAVTELAKAYAGLIQRYMEEQRIVGNLIAENTKLQARIRELENDLYYAEMFNTE